MKELAAYFPSNKKAYKKGNTGGDMLMCPGSYFFAKIIKRVKGRQAEKVLYRCLM